MLHKNHNKLSFSFFWVNFFKMYHVRMRCFLDWKNVLAWVFLSDGIRFAKDI